ncbi:hypothetical protein [Pontibacter vulgaris]|uniref:hypothetical protein n=1 Tax=Pontibacter vulgaris TaxID=2905679 RepID=UPI001FA7D7F4|nr:hypothetical protein [Pontibacter vulgaris]
MHSLLYLDLSAGTSYSNPVIQQVKHQFPEVAILDLDIQSDELMLHFAKRLLHESGRAVICFNATESETGFGKLIPLLEELLQVQPNRLLLLLGQHARLQRMAQARPDLYFKQVLSVEEVIQEVTLYLG